jgi:HAD superfamily hydrolase (TIGR01484 family)
MPAYAICDVDGCLVPPRGEMWDFTALELLAKQNLSSDITFALCSGRPPAFLEALARQLCISTYCICENGSLLMHPIKKTAMLHPAVSSEYMQQRPEILLRLQRLIAGTHTVIEFGKDVMISVNTPVKDELEQLLHAVGKELEGAPVEVMNSGRSIEVVPRGVTKAAGLAFWAEQVGTSVPAVTSIGDADNDLTILQAAGTAAAPANCTPNVRAVVDYVSPLPMVRGVLDILDQIRAGKLGG